MGMKRKKGGVFGSARIGDHGREFAAVAGDFSLEVRGMLLIFCRSRRCSFFSSSKLSSSCWCHGYRTNTWKQRAEEATAKLVNETLRVKIILLGVWDGVS